MSNITVSNFDAKKLTTSDMKKLASGAYNAYINYDGRRVRIQAPRLSIPYDAGDYKGNQKYKVQFSFRGRESNPKVQAFYKMMRILITMLLIWLTRMPASGLVWPVPVVR